MTASVAHPRQFKKYNKLQSLRTCLFCFLHHVSVQKIQQITILKNKAEVHIYTEHVQKIQQITILKNGNIDCCCSWLFKKYNKLQSLRTFRLNLGCRILFKKYNKLQSLRTVIRIISQKPFNYRLFEHFPDQTSNKKSLNHHLIDYHIP